MFRLIKLKIIIFTVAFLLMNTSSVLACSCGDNPKEGETQEERLARQVKGELQTASAVFSGQLLSAEYQKGYVNAFREKKAERTGKKIEYETLVLTFAVERSWKGDALSRMTLVTKKTRDETGSETHSSCDIDFTVGERYLIYAYGDKDRLGTGYCTRTGKLQGAEEDFKILGEGKEPVEKKDEPNKSLDVRQKQLPHKF
jgi:hypothetical protein